MSDMRKVSELPFPIRPRIQKAAWKDGYDLWLIGYEIHGGDYAGAARYCVSEVALTELGEMGLLPAPAMTIPNTEIQELMDELWRCGVRPTEVGTAGHVDALQKHAAYLEKVLDVVIPSALRKP